MKARCCGLIVLHLHDSIQDAFDPSGGQTHINFYRQCFSIKVIDDVERSKTTSAKQAITHKIDRLATINRIRTDQLDQIPIGQSLLATASLI